VLSLRQKLGVLSGLFSLKRLISSLGEEDFRSGEIIFAKAKKKLIFFLFFFSFLLIYSFILLFIFDVLNIL